MVPESVAYYDRIAPFYPVFFRDLTASGFWTTKMGIADLQYQGNVFLNEWNGCPEEALTKLGVKYS